MQVETDHVGKMRGEEERGGGERCNEGDTEVNSHTEAELS